MKTIDLHTHTIYSDGIFTPLQLFQYAREKELSAVAITDHDTIVGLKEGLIASKMYGVELVNGVEFSCFISNAEVHILGYLFDIENKNLNNEIDEISKIRIDRNKKMVFNLNRLGVSISYNELVNNADSTNISRTHFAKVLVEKGYAFDREDAFKKFLNSNCPAYVPRKNLTAAKIINLIKNANGKAVLAHPFRYNLTCEKLKNIIEKLVIDGIDGIEGIYPKTSIKQKKYIETICQKYNLLITGGSDFHGYKPYKNNTNLGSGYNNDTCVSYNILEKLKRG